MSHADWCVHACRVDDCGSYYCDVLKDSFCTWFGDDPCSCCPEYRDDSMFECPWCDVLLGDDEYCPETDTYYCHNCGWNSKKEAEE